MTLRYRRLANAALTKSKIGKTDVTIDGESVKQVERGMSSSLLYLS